MANLIDTGSSAITQITYDSLNPLGKGSNTKKVFKGLFGKTIAAIKLFQQIEFQEASIHEALCEINILKKISCHKNIVKYFSSEKRSNDILLAIELCQCDLQKWVESRGSCVASISKRTVITDICHGLVHLHQNNVIHRDIKPANILLKENDGGRVVAKITDFGISVQIPKGHDSAIVAANKGTPGWTAPEIFANVVGCEKIDGGLDNRNKTDITKAVDVFSFGCVCHYVLADGKHPFDPPQLRQSNILESKPEVTLAKNHENLFTRKVAMLTENMIAKNPYDRPSMATTLSVIRAIPADPIFRPTVPPTLSYYVPRELMTRNRLDKGVLKLAHLQILVFTGISIHQLRKLGGEQRVDTSTNQILKPTQRANLILLERQEHWLQLCELAKRPVHLIKCNLDCQEFTWLDSNENLEEIKKHLSPTQRKYFEDTFFESMEETHRNNPVCISGKPGMGKTILLARIARNLQNAGLSRVVLFISLGDWISKIKKKLQPRHSLQSIIFDSITKLSCENKEAKKLVTTFLENTTNGERTFELFLDGFDEISPDCIDLGHKCLEALRKIKNIRLWITTRPHMMDNLENRLNVLGYDISALLDADQNNFLQMYWQRNGEIFNKDKLSLFADDCLESIRTKLNIKEREFVGIALQCMMVAEIYEQDAIEYSKADIDEHSCNIDIQSIVDMYDRLVEKKITKFFTIIESKRPTKERILQIKYQHSLLALQIILPGVFTEFKAMLEELTNIYSKDDICRHDYCDNIFTNFGFMEATSTQETPNFIHRTFAEYFVAWLAMEVLENPFFADADFLVALVDEILVFSEFVDRDKFPDDVAPHVRTFEHLNVSYFFDSHLGKISSSRILPNVNLLVNHEYFKVGIPLVVKACLHSDSVNIVNFLDSLYPLGSLGQYDIGYAFVAVWCSSVDLLRKITDIYQMTLSEGQMFDKDIQTAILQLAIKRGNYDVIEYLSQLEGSMDILKMENKGSRDFLGELVFATEDCNEYQIQERIQVLRMLVNVNQLLVHIIHDDIVNENLLIELVHQKADVNRTNMYGSTVLHVAAKSLNVTREGFQKLLQAIGEHDLANLVHVRNIDGDTFLHVLVKFKNPKTETLRLLKDHGADFNAKNNLGYTILTQSVGDGDYVMLTGPKRIKVWTVLSKFGVNMHNEKNLVIGRSWKGCILHSAAHRGNVEAVEHFLKNEGMNVNFPDSRGETPLDHTLKWNFGGSGRLDVARFLISHGGIMTKNHQQVLYILDRALARWDRVTAQIALMLIGDNINAKSNDGLTPLHIICRSKLMEQYKIEMVESLLANGANVNEPNLNGESPLTFMILHACYDLSTDMFNLLRSYGADLPGQLAYPLLIWICTQSLEGGNSSETTSEQNIGHRNFESDKMDIPVSESSTKLSIIKYLLLNFVPDVNEKDSNGDTALHEAINASYGRWTPTIDLLLELGADVNACNKRDETPMHLQQGIGSSERDQEMRLKLLKLCIVKYNADIHIPDNAGFSMIHSYIDKHVISSSEIHEVILILRESDNLHIFHSTEPASLLHLAVSKVQIPDETLKILHDYGINYGMLDEDGRSLIMAAASLQSQYYFQELEKLGANFNIIDKGNNSMLHYAARYDDLLTVQYILSELNGFDVNQKNEDGCTPLHLAAMYASESCSFISGLLIKQGADVNIVNKDDETPFDAGLRRKNSIFQLARLMDNESNKIERLFLRECQSSSSSEFHKFVQKLVKSDTFHAQEIDRENYHSLLHLAIFQMDVEGCTLHLLHSHGVRFQAVDRFGNTLLMTALMNERCASFQQELVKLGTDWRRVNNEGRSVLHIAASTSNVAILRFYLNEVSGCDVNIIDQDGNTPLHCAVLGAQECILEMVMLLVENNADVSIENKGNMTPTQAAISRRLNSEIVLFLIAAGCNQHKFECEAVETFITSACNSPTDFHELVSILIEFGHVNFLRKKIQNGRNTLLQFVERRIGVMNVTYQLIEASKINLA